MIDIYKLFGNEIWLPDDCTNCIWHRTDCEVSWGDDLDDLMMGDGDTYSCEVYGKVERDGYVLYTLYDGCGNKIQAIFKLDNEVNEDEYWEAKELEESEDD